MSPKDLIRLWVKLFNEGNANEIAALYHENATNHQMPNEAIKGHKAIFQMFKTEFERYDMTCIIENLFEDGEWVILEWKGQGDKMRGCGFFHIIEGKIVLQRGYWDKLTFIKEQTGISPE